MYANTIQFMLLSYMCYICREGVLRLLRNSIKVMMLRTLVIYAEVTLQNLHRAHDIVFRKLIFSFGQEFIMLFLDKKDLLKDSWNSKNLCWKTL